MKNTILPIAALVLLGIVLLPAQMRANTTETQLTGDANGTSSINGTTNWTPATTVAPTDPLASSYDYTSAFTLRTPTGAGNYTVLANSLSINNGGTLTMKGYGTNTVNNLILLTGGKITQSGTGVPVGNPDTAWLAGNINLAGNATITSSTSTGTNQFLTILAAITNATSANLTVDGATSAAGSGTLVLAAHNTFNGAITLNNRAPSVILRLGLDNALPATTVLTLNGGSSGSPIVDLNGYSMMISNLTFTGGTFTGLVTNGAPNTTSTLTLGYNDATETLSTGAIADNPDSNSVVALTKVGNGTLTVNVAYAYSGDTTVSAGTLKMGGTSITPNGPGKGNLIVNGMMDLSGRSETVNGLSGSGNIDNSTGTATYALTVGNNDATSTFNGVIANTSGTVTLTKMGAGALYLTSDNTFAGNVTIKTGAVWIATSGALGVTPKDIVIQKYSGGASSELHLNGTNGDLSLPSSLWFFTGNSTGDGAIANEAGNNTIDGPILLNTGGSTLITVNGGSLALEGAIYLASGQSSRVLVLGGANNGTLDGVMSDGDSGLLSVTKNGNGTWTIANANTYTGTTAVNGGTLALGAASSIVSSPSVIVQAGGTLDASAVSGGWTLDASQTLSGYGTIIGNVTANGTVAPGTALGTLTFANHLTLADSSASIMAINRTNAPANADLISAAALTFGGTLTVTNVGDPLQAGDTFNLFDGALDGQFTTTNLPSLFSPDFYWDTSLLASQGIIKVGSSAAPRPTIEPVTVSGTNLNIQFFSTAGFNYYLESATNIAAPVWVPIGTNSGGGIIQLQVPISTTTPKEFFRLSVGAP